MYYTLELLFSRSYGPEFGSYDREEVLFERDLYRDNGDVVRIVRSASAEAYQREYDARDKKDLSGKSLAIAVEAIHPGDEAGN